MVNNVKIRELLLEIMLVEPINLAHALAHVLQDGQEITVRIQLHVLLLQIFIMKILIKSLALMVVQFQV
jgi:hypothetical protein